MVMVWAGGAPKLIAIIMPVAIAWIIIHPLYQIPSTLSPSQGLLKDDSRSLCRRTWQVLPRPPSAALGVLVPERWRALAWSLSKSLSFSRESLDFVEVAVSIPASDIEVHSNGIKC